MRVYRFRDTVVIGTPDDTIYLSPEEAHRTAVALLTISADVRLVDSPSSREPEVLVYRLANPADATRIHREEDG